MPRGSGPYLSSMAIVASACLPFGARAIDALWSSWLAGALAKLIDQSRQPLRQIAEAHDFSRKVPRTGSRLELDAFTDPFIQMVPSPQSAEAQTALEKVRGEGHGRVVAFRADPERYRGVVADRR